MFKLERTKKVITVMFCFSIISLLLSFIGFAGGGEELIRYGIMNNPGYTILMFVSFGIFFVSLITGIGFRALCKDTVDELKYLYENEISKSKG